MVRKDRIKLKKMKKILLALYLGGLVLGSLCFQSSSNDPIPNITGIEEKVDSVLALMTIEEKIGQLTLFTSDWAVTGPTLRENYRADVKSGRVGAIFNAHTAGYNRALQRIAVEESRLGIPLIFGYDVVHGYKTIFPIPLGEAASWDLEAIELSARIAGEEAAAAGLHWTFAPMVDIARDPRWGRIMEGAGEDVYLGSLIAAARVKGFQGEGIGSTGGVLACPKHYAAYGAAQAGRDYHTVDISERELRTTYLPPFKSALDAGAKTIMTSFNELDGVPVTGNAFLLDQVLRQEWKFDGFVVSDYTSVNEMVQHGIVGDEKAAGELALNAGLDMDMQGAVYYNHLAKSLEEGKVTMEQIDQAVRRILSLKFELGLFEDPYRFSDENREQEQIMAEDHLEAAREVSKKSIVLLKNEQQTLPLSKEKKQTYALIGPLMNTKKELIGAWSGAGDHKQSISLLEGIKAKIGSDADLYFAQGCQINDSDKKGFDEALLAAMKSDIVIVAVGEAAQMSGEAASRSDISLPGVQKELVQALSETGKPIIVVLMNGRPLALPEVDQAASALLETWFLGTQAGHAIADVLFGDYNPSGKLPVSFPRNAGQIPVYYNMKNTGRPMNPKEKYTSKYLDVSNDPLYPFGYGLSYTNFYYGPIQIDNKKFSGNETVNVTITITNTGSYAGNEVVQLYIRDLVGSVTRPVKELKGFQKIYLEPGVKKEVTFSISLEDLKFYTRSMKYAAEPGEFEVFIGPNSRDTKSVKIELTDL